MSLPPELQPGDTVGVIAPSGPFERERLMSGLAFLRAKGFEVREGASLYAQNRYLAGTDRARADDVNAMFADGDVKGIFVARAWIWGCPHFGIFGLGVYCSKSKGAGGAERYDGVAVGDFCANGVGDIFRVVAVFGCDGRRR